jgi:hypothetical protein
MALGKVGAVKAADGVGDLGGCFLRQAQAELDAANVAGQHRHLAVLGDHLHVLLDLRLA